MHLLIEKMAAVTRASQNVVLTRQPGTAALFAAARERH
jgi:hypothetical protein